MRAFMITPVQWIWQPQMPLPLERFRLKGNLSYISPSCAIDCHRTGMLQWVSREKIRDAIIWSHLQLQLSSALRESMSAAKNWIKRRMLGNASF